MLKVTYRKKGIKLSHVWFATDGQITSGEFRQDCGDIIYLHGINAKSAPEGGIRSRQLSLIKELTPDKESLFLSLGKHLRQYIKKSEKEQKIVIQILSSVDLLKKQMVISQIAVLYEKMFKDKGMTEHFNVPLAKKYIQQDALIVALAMDETRPVGFSAVVHDHNHSRLWLTGFDFRDERNDSQVLSRAHQRLDWELLCWCKDHGIMSFDFGGVNSFEDPDGISQFKMKFENENRVEYYNYLFANSIVGKIALKYVVKKGI